VLNNRTYWLERIAVALGGRVAEELIFGEITTGASADIQMLTSVARAMVTKFGMSETMGALQFGQQGELVFLGRELAEQRDYSEEVAEQIDAEVRRIVTESHARVRALMTTNLDQLHAIARALLERETLNSDDLHAIIATA
jgi:cell division protease FtsH